MSRPTLILVHGSWHSPQHFVPLIKDLTSHGYKCTTVSLPSTQDSDTPPATLTDDTNAVRSAVESELSTNNVVIVAHSYGGCPTNNALKDLSTTSRHTAGHTTSVLAIAFLAAIPLPVGMTFLQMLGGKPHALHDLRTPDFAWVGSPGPQYYFYNGMEPEEAAEWAKLLRVQSWKAYLEATTYAAYLEIPCFYLRCTKDQAFPFEAQGGLIEAAVEAGAKIRQETIESDHTPFLGKQMGKTNDFIRRVAEDRFEESKP